MPAFREIVTGLLRRERGWPTQQAGSPFGDMIWWWQSTKPRHSTSRSDPAQGQLSYLQIPALNVQRSADSIREFSAGTSSTRIRVFDAPGLIGQWTTDGSRRAMPACCRG